MSGHRQDGAPVRPTVRLVGTDGNVFAIIGRVRRALRDAGQEERATAFVARAWAAGSYDEVLALVLDYVDAR